MKRIRNLFIGTVSIVALSAFPLHLDLGSLGSFDLSVAYAKGGNGNGGGNGKGGSHGESGSHGSNAGSSSSGKTSGGKSASAFGHSKSLFGRDRTRSANVAGMKSSSKVKVAKESGQTKGHAHLAALPATVEAPELRVNVKEKNFHAKLAGLNSLNRNFHAYLNSQSPKFASVQDFVRKSAEFDLANEKLNAANADLAAAQTDFDSLVANSNITPFDGDTSAYDDPTLAGLKARLDHLNSITVAPQDQAALDAEISGLESILGSSDAAALADAEDAAAEAQTAPDEASIGTDDAALKAALLDAANKNRVAEFGDDYVDDEVMTWAKGVLGVGAEIGKIDEVREAIR
jgi:hypothetical protein